MKRALSVIILFASMQLVTLSSCKGKANPLDLILNSRMPFAKDETIIEPPSSNTKTKSNAIPDDDDLIRLPEKAFQEDPSLAAPKDASANFLPPLAPPVAAEAVFLPPPADDFVNLVPFNWGFAQCGNNVVSNEIDPETGFINGEECEDGNAANGDGCSSTCLKEFCGNGVVELGEQCDPGQRPTSPPTVPPVWNQAIPTEDCDRFCELIICGDGIVNGDEECDDCNRIDCDGCSSDCRLQPLSDPPCNFTCTPTTPFTCTVTYPQSCTLSVTPIIPVTPVDTLK